MRISYQGSDGIWHTLIPARQVIIFDDPKPPTLWECLTHPFFSARRRWAILKAQWHERRGIGLSASEQHLLGYGLDDDEGVFL